MFCCPHAGQNLCRTSAPQLRQFFSSRIVCFAMRRSGFYSVKNSDFSRGKPKEKSSSFYYCHSQRNTSVILFFFHHFLLYTVIVFFILSFRAKRGMTEMAIGNSNTEKGRRHKGTECSASILHPPKKTVIPSEVRNLIHPSKVKIPRFARNDN